MRLGNREYGECWVLTRDMAQSRRVSGNIYEGESSPAENFAGEESVITEGKRENE